MRRIEVSAQVVSFVRARAPEPRRRLRLALRQLSRERGDIKPLEARLKHSFRLRVGSYRIVFRYSASGKTIHCIFAENRDLVYELFARFVEARLLGRKN